MYSLYFKEPLVKINVVNNKRLKYFFIDFKNLTCQLFDMCILFHRFSKMIIKNVSLLACTYVLNFLKCLCQFRVATLYYTLGLCLSSSTHCFISNHIKSRLLSTRQEVNVDFGLIYENNCTFAVYFANVYKNYHVHLCKLF